jgi:hypothetical protein
MAESDDVAAINNAMAEPVPSMAVVPEVTIDLIRGLHDADNDVWHTEAEVRELTGEDEEYLAGLETKKGLLYSDYMASLLARAVIRIGDLVIDGGPKSKAIINKLMLADRDLLYLGVVKATYGDTRLINVVCSSCKTKNDVELVLEDDFPIHYPEFDIRKGLTVETSKGQVTLRLPNGDDTVYAQENTKNDAELNTVMLSRCAVWPSGEAPQDALKWARSLNIGDRKKLINSLLDVKVGPTLEEVDTQCASCGEDMPILLDWVSLLLG